MTALFPIGEHGVERLVDLFRTHSPVVLEVFGNSQPMHNEKRATSAILRSPLQEQGKQTSPQSTESLQPHQFSESPASTWHSKADAASPMQEQRTGQDAPTPKLTKRLRSCQFSELSEFCLSATDTSLDYLPLRCAAIEADNERRSKSF